jgi:hypothetical protein
VVGAPCVMTSTGLPGRTRRTKKMIAETPMITGMPTATRFATTLSVDATSAIGGGQTSMDYLEIQTP